MAEPHTIHARSLTSILLEAGVVTIEQVDAGLIRQRTTGLRIGETLVEMGAATEEDIGWALARQLDLPFMDPHPEALDRDLIKSFPDGMLYRLDAVPLVQEGETLSVALADPTDADVVDELTRVAGRPLTLAVAAPSAIRRVLRDILGPRHDLRGAFPVAAADTQFDVQWDRSGASFLLFHAEGARRAGASEVHFLAHHGSLEVCHRVGRRLTRVGSEPPAALYYLLARIEALGGPAIDDRTLHATGWIVCPTGTDGIGLLVSLLHQEHGISVTLELRPASAQLPRLHDLGLDPQDLASLRWALGVPSGLGIVCGPPRSGGSTTLAALFAEIGIEDRRSLAFGLPAALAPADVRVAAAGAEAAAGWREACVAQCADTTVLDGVLCGDAITAVLASEASGRWVLARTDWMDTFALLDHLAGRAQDRASLADRLRFVVQQRLVGAGVASATNTTVGLRADRCAALEVLVVGDAFRDALRAGAPMAKLREMAQHDGFQPLSNRIEALVTAGTTDEAEAARARS